MRIVGLRLINWCRYKGAQELALGPGAYAVLAKHEADEGRSNWLGKSALLSAVWFALTGEKPPSARYEDDWISRSKDGSWGADEGGVELELDDGTFISRLRTRGQSTQLTVERPGMKSAAQDYAQEVIDQLVGFSRKDSRVTWYAEQREISRLVRMDPTPRTEVFMQWTGLGRVDDAVEGCLSTVPGIADELRDIDLKRVGLQEHVVDEAAKQTALDAVLVKIEEDTELLREHRRQMASWQACQDVAKLDVQVAELREQVVSESDALTQITLAEQSIKQDQDRLKDYRDKLTQLQAQKELAKQAARYDELGLLIAKLGDSESEAAEAAMAEHQKNHEAAALVAAEANREVTAKKRLAVGQFDGVCPVGGIQCPAKDQLNADRATNVKLLKGATTAWEASHDAEVLARQGRDKAQEAVRLAVAIDQRRGMLEQERAKLKPVADEWAATKPLQEPVEPRTDVAMWSARAEQWRGKQARSKLAREKLVTLRAKRAELVLDAGDVTEEPEPPTSRAAELGAERQRIETELQWSRHAVEQLAATAARREELLRKREVATTSVAVLESAQRRIAQVSVGAIEAAANGILRRSMIPLDVAVSWERETKEAAVHCRQCGGLFPKSKRVKTCEQCGAERGNKVERKVDIKLSDVSGGAEDLAGFALQMAAFAYLKRARAAGWGVLMVDEPFGALDKSNGANVSRYLDGMLRSLDGVEQALVVSHDQGLLDALPGRILITGDDEWSRAEVVG